MPFISPAPAEGDDEVLYDLTFTDTLRGIVDHVFAGTRPPRGMTFGIYGEWGTGKSTALKAVIRLLANEFSKQGSEAEFSNFIFTEFNAAAWEPFRNARVALAYEILNSHSGALSAVEDQLADGDDLPSQSYAASPLVQAGRMFSSLASLDDSPIVEHWIQGEVRRRVETVGSIAQIVLIDDLDRCSPEFTFSLLTATNYWSSIRDIPLYFIIAADRNHLIGSLGEYRHGVRAEQALEKYIHMGIVIPEFLNSSAVTAAYFTAMLERAGPQGERFKILAEDATDNPNNCVIAPLLRFSVKDSLTPRSAKDRTNALLAHFNPAPNSSDESLRRDAKSAMIRMYWREFWDRVVKPLLPGGLSPSEANSLVSALDDLVAFGRMIGRYWTLEDSLLEGFNFTVERIGEGAPSWAGVDARLAMYLAMDPEWSPPPQSSTESGRKGQLLAATDEVSTAGHVASSTNLEEGQAIEDQILMLYLTAEGAQKAGDRGGARRALEQLVALVGPLHEGARLAPRLGNAALVAERIEEGDLAGALHAKANELDPTHWNIAQNYVTFILDEGLSSQYGRATQLLSELQTDGRSWKPERTAILALRVAAATGASSDSDDMTANLLRPEIQRAISDGSVDAMVPIMSLYPAYVSDRELLDIGSEFARRQEDIGDLYRVLRVVADALALSGDKEIELNALRMYDFILRSGLRDPEGGNEHAILHNAASLMRSLGFRKAAVLVWAEAYRLQPDELRVRRSLAENLGRVGLEDFALNVLQGESLGELSLDGVEWPQRSDFSEPAWLDELSIPPLDPFPISLMR